MARWRTALRLASMRPLTCSMGLQESLDRSLGFFQRESIRVLLWNHCVHEAEQVCSSLLCRLADFAPTLPLV